MSEMRSILSLIVILLGLTGCAVTSVDGRRMPLRSDRFANYVEDVFRRQNEVAAELAFAIDESAEDDARFATLEDAELTLMSACRGLNQLARTQRAGESPGGLGALKRARGAPACEDATAQAAALLSEFE